MLLWCPVGGGEKGAGDHSPGQLWMGLQKKSFWYCDQTGGECPELSFPFKVLQAQAGSVHRGLHHVRGWGAMAEITAAPKEAKGMFIILSSFWILTLEKQNMQDGNKDRVKTGQNSWKRVGD